MTAKLAVVSAGCCAMLSAQSTWVVNAAGGSGVHFPDLPSAVAAPNVVDGDTILVHTGPSQQGADAFTSNKGLTIVGVGGMVPLYTDAANRIVVIGLPAGRAFRMVGFDQPTRGSLNFWLVGNAGEVHLEQISAHDPGLSFPTWPAIDIQSCASVTLRDVETFGAPAVSCTASRLALVSCRLGRSDLGLGGGQALLATGSAVDIVQPDFDPQGWSAGTVVSTNGTLRIAGDTTSLLSGGGGTPIVANGGLVFVDPAVPMPSPSGPPITGTAVVTFVSVPASWTSAAGQLLKIVSTAAPGAFVFQALGAPGPLTTTPLGELGIDPLQWYGFFAPLPMSAAGVAAHTINVPAALPRGLAFASQSLVLNGPLLQLGLPVTFVLH
ncbi:MAG TPA: hypothetical protein VF384_11750 [Planctomycetota bacterium]